MTATGPAVSRPILALLLALLVLNFAVRNLPWHLDDFDQAKQAFVSFEMVETGQWWFQHTPGGKIATKPPLAGWISAGLYFVFGKGGWEFAWRLPSFASALILVAMLWRTGGRIAGTLGALLAVSAFGFNLLAPRLATLVRTDMLLTLLIFFSGWLIHEKIRHATPWTGAERWAFGLAVLGAMLVKGPILYAFVLPGVAVYAVLARRRGWPNHGWPGWLPWTVPLLAFGAWVFVGVQLSEDFYRQVVLREFLGRFDMSDAPVHKHQPFYFYLPHLLQKWGPWGVALIALFSQRRLRERLQRDPAWTWLACWALGGLVLMSLVPSKRVDRIFPVIPPLCLLLAAAASEWFSVARPRQGRIAAGIVALGVAISVGYTAIRVVDAFRTDQRALVRFGNAVAAGEGRLAVASGADEGMLLYTRQTRFTRLDEAADRWQRREIDRLVLREKDLLGRGAEFQPYRKTLEVGPIENKRGPYFLIERAAASPEAAPPK